MDVLSEVLKVVKLQGAMFYNGEFSAPWSLRSPPSHTIAPYLAPGAEHVIIYHLVTEGRASVRLENGESLVLGAGEIVVFPHGDPHVVENGAATRTVDMSQELTRVFCQGLKLSRLGGGGELTRFVCGYMACESQLSQVFSVACRRCSKSVFVMMHPVDGWRTQFGFPWITPTALAPAKVHC